MATKSRAQFLLVTSGAKACRSLSIAMRAQLVTTDMTEVRLKAKNQAPISRTPLGVGFLKLGASRYKMIFQKIGCNKKYVLCHGQPCRRKLTSLALVVGFGI